MARTMISVMALLACWIDWECVRPIKYRSVKRWIPARCSRCVPAKERTPTGLTLPTHAFRGWASITLQLQEASTVSWGRNVYWCRRIPCGYSNRKRTAISVDIRGPCKIRILFGHLVLLREGTKTTTLSYKRMEIWCCTEAPRPDGRPANTGWT